MADDHTLHHLHDLLYCNQGIGICGCGQPEQAVALIRAILDLAPFYEDDNWEKLEPLIGTAGAVHIVLGALDRAELIEHGGVITGSWLTDKGRWAKAAFAAIPDNRELLDAAGEAGIPHWHSETSRQAECTDACWAATPVADEEPMPTGQAFMKRFFTPGLAGPGWPTIRVE